MYTSIQFAYSKKPFWIFLVTVVGTLINVLANMYMIPRYGLMGAGLATVASVSGVNLILTYIGQKLFRIRYEWKTIIPLFGTILAAVLVILGLGRTEIGRFYMYAIKSAIILGFISIGIMSKIISPHSLQTVFHSLFQAPRRAG
jgi:O-antigen/teichoic acid export membrane protein